MKSSIACALGLCLLAGHVQAQSAGVEGEIARAKARAMAHDGAQQYDDGNYTAALSKFLEAYATFASPRLYFNLGQTYMQLGRYVDATLSFQRFLADAADAPADTRTLARNSIAEMRDRVARVQISSNVAGAEVLIDGQSHGLTPLPHPVLVATGPHQVVLQKAGSATFLRRIEAQGNATLKVEAQLAAAAADPEPSTATPVTTPAGAAPLESESAEFNPLPVVESEADRGSWIPSTWTGKLGLGLVAVGPILIGTGLYFGKQAQNNADAIKQMCATSGCLGSAIVDEDSERKSNGTMQWVLIGTGAATMVSGVVLYILGRDADSPVSVAFDGQSATAVMHGSW